MNAEGLSAAKHYTVSSTTKQWSGMISETTSWSCVHWPKLPLIPNFYVRLLDVSNAMQNELITEYICCNLSLPYNTSTTVQKQRQTNYIRAKNS